jgi:predicted Zn-dependent protease
VFAKPTTKTLKHKKSFYKPFQQVIQQTKKLKGLFTLYQKDGKFFLEIKQNQLNSPFLLTISLTRGLGAGDWVTGSPINNFIFKWKRIHHQIQFIEENPYITAAKNTTQAEAVKDDFTSSVLASLKILSINKNHAVLIDATPLFLSDLAGLSHDISSSLKGNYSFNVSRSYIQTLKTFPLNDEIQTDEVFVASSKPKNRNYVQMIPNWRSLSLGIHYSISRLPQDHYVPRLADDRIGYFLTAIKNFSSKSVNSPIVRYINRWNMHKKPIVFWIENTTPKKYRPVIKSAILEWNKAFAKIGIKNAVEVKIQPEHSKWKPGDIRYNMVYWMDSSHSDFSSFGPSEVNPLTGEIYSAQIVIDGGMIRDIKHLYINEISPSLDLTGYLQKQFVRSLYHTSEPDNLSIFPELEEQQGELGALSLALNSSQPGRFKVPGWFVDAYLKSVIMHESGHCLGLRHNFHASTYLPFKDIFNYKITSKEGLSASVMDYLPANIPPSPKMKVNYFTPTIGAYDYWAIQYGYTPLNGRTPEQDKKALKKIASLSAKPGHVYETDENTYGPYAIDPLSEIFDLSRNPLKYAVYRFQLYHRLWKEINQKWPAQGESYHRLRIAFDMTLGGYAFYTQDVARFIGGEYYSKSHKGDPGAGIPLTPVPKTVQVRALNILNLYLFSPDAFAFSPRFLNKLAPEVWYDHFSVPEDFLKPYNYPIRGKIAKMQEAVLNRFFSPVVLNRVLDMQKQVKNQNQILSLSHLFSWMTYTFFSEVRTGKNINGFRRSLQNSYLNHLIGLIIHPHNEFHTVLNPDARDLAYLQLGYIEREMRRDLKQNRARLNSLTLAHLEFELHLIHQAVKARLKEVL